jgi:hypothetical protein
MGTANAGNRLSAALLSRSAWTAMTLASGWTNGGGGNVNAQYASWPLMNAVLVTGYLHAGTLTNGTSIATGLPAPSSQQTIPVNVIATSGSIGGDSPLMYIETGGTLNVYDLPSGTTLIGFSGIYYLDA